MICGPAFLFTAKSPLEASNPLAPGVFLNYYLILQRDSKTRLGLTLLIGGNKYQHTTRGSQIFCPLTNSLCFWGPRFSHV